jgi:hypothetical protein
MSAAQFPGRGIEHFEILEMVEIHGLFPIARASIEMSYAGLPASMGRPCASQLPAGGRCDVHIA